jgi:hypothetical protein
MIEERLGKAMAYAFEANNKVPFETDWVTTIPFPIKKNAFIRVEGK